MMRVADAVGEDQFDLRPAERKVIEPAFYRHLIYREVTTSLNIPEGTVKSRIRLGLVRLRRELAQTELFDLAS